MGWLDRIEQKILGVKPMEEAGKEAGWKPERDYERVLIVSDTHGRQENFQKVVDKVMPDRVLHLGDCERCEFEIEEIAGCPVEFVRGNCDFASASPNETIVTLGRHQAFLTHGHLYEVKYNNQRLASAAEAEGCDVAMYGHTHMPELTTETVRGSGKEITVLNPGSISQPRQPGRKPSYCVLDIDSEGELHFYMNYL